MTTAQTVGARRGLARACGVGLTAAAVVVAGAIIAVHSRSVQATQAPPAPAAVTHASSVATAAPGVRGVQNPLTIRVTFDADVHQVVLLLASDAVTRNQLVALDPDCRFSGYTVSCNRQVPSGIPSAVHLGVTPEVSGAETVIGVVKGADAPQGGAATWQTHLSVSDGIPT